MKERVKILVMFFVALVMVSTATGEIIFVDADAIGANNGSSWANAYKYLQNAFGVASSGDEIRVAEGIYKPDEDSAHPNGTDSRTATFRLKNGVVIRGGYAGFGQPDPDTRDINTYETILSGDLFGNDGPDFANNYENSYHVVTGSGTDLNTVLDGFIITGGNANGDYPDYGGGGMYSNSGNPMLINCTFINNSAKGYGGGIFQKNGNPILTNCIFTRNSSGVFGGGIYYSYSSEASATLTNCTLSGNSAEKRGGGIYAGSGGIKMTNCILWANWSRGGMYESAQVYSWRLRSSINYCCIQGLTVNFGGVGNIGSDPMFVGEPSPGPDGIWGTVDDDFIDLHLRCGSPCLDTGTNNTTPPLPSADPDGIPRVVNGTVDMGAFEGSNQAFVIDPAPALVPEGGTASFTVALTCEIPDGIDVTVAHHSGDTDIRIESGAVLRFDSTNFSEPQIVVVAAAEDSDRLEGAARLGINAAGVSYTEVVTWEVENDVGDLVFVDADASGANDGTSWQDAFTQMQDAITFACGVRWALDEIRVGQGIHKPDQGAGITLGNREAVFQLISDVAIKGGYAGVGEPDPNARDIKAYKTILSGDLSGDDIDVAELRDLLDDPSRAENSYHVVMGSRTDATAVLGGFTIIGGNANGPISEWPDFDYSRRYGGGMYNNNGSPTVTNCTFSGNSAEWRGGGMSNHDVSSPTVINCMFTRNYGQRAGGGMYNWQNSSTTISNCTFSENKSGSGGGLSNFESNMVLFNCIFLNNSSIWEGGGMSNSHSADPVVKNCTFIGNSSIQGGGIHNYESSLKMTNCKVSGNRAKWNGGGMYMWAGMPSPGGPCFTERPSNVTLISCTFSENQAEYGRALACDSCDNQFPSKVQITNCILWDGGNEIWKNDGSTITINYSDIQGGWPGDGNIEADPCFVSLGYWDANGTPDDDDDFWVDGNYHLLPSSTCIDAGDPNYIAEPNETDLDGKPRIIYGRIDMGAYEYFVPPVEVAMRFTPQALNCRSQGNWVKAHLTLPEGFAVADVDSDRPAVLHSLGFESAPLYVFVNKDKLVEIEAAFEREAVCSLAGDWPQMLTVAGFLADGNIFLGRSKVRIIHPGMKVIEELANCWLQGDCVHPTWCDGIDMNRDSLVNLLDYALLMNINVEFVSE